MLATEKSYEKKVDQMIGIKSYGARGCYLGYLFRSASQESLWNGY